MTDAHCDLCDLPLAQCVHGQPPPPPPVAKAPPAPRKRATTTRATAPEKVVVRRWSPPDVFKPLILEVLRDAGGVLDAEDLFLELEIVAEDRLTPGDREAAPGGELRWHGAARRARLALVDEGLMVKDKPGVWQLAGRER
ncbi:MAG TPA: hypothetical protein VLI04_09735 [Nocardioidaceae bacterium]|nr:hypothetical protein [Nocardioidaceae bacterium]